MKWIIAFVFTMLIFCHSTVSLGDDSQCIGPLVDLPIADISSVIKESKSPFTAICEGIEKCQKLNYDSRSVNCSEIESQSKKSFPSNGKNCGLSNEEKAVLHFYMATGFSCLNAYLRSDKKIPEVDLLKDVLNQGLSKLPNYEGFVMRGINLPKEARLLHAKGLMINYKAFTSTSVSMGFDNKTDQFIIFSKTGKATMGFNINEGEVLFQSGASFKVLDNFDQSGIHYFVMKEVLPNENAANEEQLEKEILQKVEKHKTDYATIFDEWVCPKKGSVPEKVQQKYLPRFIK